MNPLVKKEIRLLLPAWIAAILLAIVPIWIASVWSRVPPEANLYVELAFGLGVLFLSIASFGEEFSFGAFSILLSQPMERRRIWLIKTTVLGIAFVSVLLALAVSWQLDFFIRTARIPNFLTEFGFLALFVAVIFSSGLWATLLLRRMLEAFWLTLLAPLAIMFGLYVVHEHFQWSNQTDNYVIPAVLLLYSLAGFFWARRLFFRAQDLQWTGGIITLPSRKRIAERTASRPRRWFAALVWKELQLHQVNILIAGVVLVLHLASVVIRRVHPNFDNPNVKGILELIWMLWLLMPLLIGSAAVAEEHRSGTFESQLCLPVSRRTQFALKFFVGLILSLVLGGVMPFVIEWTRDFSGIIFVVAAVIFFISFYASTVARTTLQAMGLAIVLAVVIYFYEAATAVSIFEIGRYLPNVSIGLELLKLYLGIPILVLVLGGLMYWNFKWLHSEGNLRWRNGITFLAALAFIFVCTNAIYFRAWELLTPIEPSHGPARLNESAQVKFIAAGSAAYALLPDGRLWSEALVWRPVADGWGQTLEPGKSRFFINGSNWITMAGHRLRAVAIRADGTLWILQRYSYEQQNEPKLAQIGSDTNWAQVASVSENFLLLKEDGTLWVWRPNLHNDQEPPKMVAEPLKPDLTTLPLRISGESNWTEVFTFGPSYQETANAIKKDASIWELSLSWKSNGLVNTSLQPTTMDRTWRSFLSLNPPFDAGVTTNGELWFISYIQAARKFILEGKNQLGRDSKWQAAALSYSDLGSVIAIRHDGTLWKWRNCWELQNVPNPSMAKPIQLGNHSDWIALWPEEGLVLALAADGSLWAWGEPSRHVWLAPPRKPVYLGNIFTAH